MSIWRGTSLCNTTRLLRCLVLQTWSWIYSTRLWWSQQLDTSRQFDLPHNMEFGPSVQEMVTAGIYVFDINIRSTVGDPGSFLLRKLDTLQVEKCLDQTWLDPSVSRSWCPNLQILNHTVKATTRTWLTHESWFTSSHRAVHNKTAKKPIGTTHSLLSYSTCNINPLPIPYINLYEYWHLPCQMISNVFNEIRYGHCSLEPLVTQSLDREILAYWDELLQ